MNNHDHLAIQSPMKITYKRQLLFHREDKVNRDVDAETGILSPILPSPSYARKKSKGKKSTVSEESCEADDKSGDSNNDSPHQNRRQHIHPEEDIMRSEAPIRQSKSITEQYNNIIDDNIHHKSASPIVETAEMEEHQSTDGSEKSLLNASFIGSFAYDNEVEEISDRIAAQKGTEVECERQTGEASDEEHENDVEDEGLEVHADGSHLEESVHLHHGYSPALGTIFEETTLKSDETNKDDNQNESIRSRKQNPETVGSVDALVENHDAFKNHSNIRRYVSVAVQTEVRVYASVAVQTEVSGYASVAMQTEVSRYASVAVQTEDRAKVQQYNSCKRKLEREENIEDSAKKPKNSDWWSGGFFIEKPMVYTLCNCKGHVCKKS